MTMRIKSSREQFANKILELAAESVFITQTLAFGKKLRFLLSHDDITRQYSCIMPLSVRLTREKKKKKKGKSGERALDQPDRRYGRWRWFV